MAEKAKHGITKLQAEEYFQGATYRVSKNGRLYGAATLFCNCLLHKMLY